jgi:cell division protein FtsQ
MFKKFKIKTGIVITGLAVCLFSLIGFVEKKAAEKVFNEPVIKINFEHDNYFLDKEVVRNLMTMNGQEEIAGALYKDINLKTLELRIKSHKFVEDAQVYKDHKGNLMVEVQQCRPIGRIIQTNGPHAYIGTNGNSLPTSEKFTARVVLLDGEKATKLMNADYLKSEEGKKYLGLLKMIDEDPFWKSQITQISVNKAGEIRLYPQVGQEFFDLGMPEELEIKFKKLKLYYNEILPLKGFNKYRSVNLKYKDQIICE